MGADEGSRFTPYVGSGPDTSGDNKHDFGRFIVGDMPQDTNDE